MVQHRNELESCSLNTYVQPSLFANREDIVCEKSNATESHNNFHSKSTNLNTKKATNTATGTPRQKQKQVKGSGFKVRKLVSSNSSGELPWQEALSEEMISIKREDTLTIRHLHEKLVDTDILKSKKFSKYEKQKALSNSTGNIALASNKTEMAEDMSSLVISESTHKIKKTTVKARSKNPMTYTTKQIDLNKLPDQHQQAITSQLHEQQYATTSNKNYAKYLAGKSNLNLKSDFNFNRKINGKNSISSNNLYTKRDAEGMISKEGNVHEDPYISFQNKMKSQKGIMSMIKKYNKHIVTSPKPKNKLPLLSTRSQDNLNSDSYVYSSNKQSLVAAGNKPQLKEDSRTSFESLEFVKKISPQYKYDIQPELNELERAPHINSEIFFEMSSCDFGLNDEALLFAEYNRQRDSIAAPGLRSCPSPVVTSTEDRIENLRYESMIYNDYTKRLTLKANKAENRNNQVLSTTKPQLTSRKVNIHQLTKLKTSRKDDSEQNLSNEGTSSFIMENPFSNSINYLNQRQNNLLHISEARTYEELNRSSVRTHHNNLEDDHEDDDSYNPIMERDAAKLSNVDDKFYLDIFIPCAN